MAKAKKQRAPVEQIEVRPLASLVPYAQNPRLHSDEQVEQLAASLTQFGQAALIVVDEDGEIIAGHGRVLAAQRLGWTEMRVAVASGWSEKKKRAYRIADNQLALTSRWDQDLLRSELKLLDGAEIDLALLGFDDGYLRGLLAPLGTADDPMGEWTGMPEFVHGDKTAYRSLVIHFKDAAAVEQFEKLIGHKLTNRFMWYPEIEIEVAHAKRYVSSK